MIFWDNVETGKRTIADILSFFFFYYRIISYSIFLSCSYSINKNKRSKVAICIIVRGNICREFICGLPEHCFWEDFSSDWKASVTSPMTLGTFDGHFLPLEESQHWLTPFNFDVQILHSNSVVVQESLWYW